MSPRNWIALMPVVVLAGCNIATTGSTLVKYPISGGQMAEVEFSGRGGVLPSENGDVRLSIPVLDADGATHSAWYQFGFLERRGQVPRSVKVEDVSDNAPVTWLEDSRPALSAGRWEMRSRAFGAGDRSSDWLHEIEPSVRIFRFTIVTADGRTLVMYQAAVFQNDIKDSVNRQLVPPPASPDSVRVPLGL